MTKLMKDSNVEWIGKIPIDWKSIKLNSKIEFFSGFAFKSAEFTNAKDGKKVITISSFNNNMILNNKLSFSKEKLKYKESFLVKNNDILFAMSGGTVGKNVYIDFLSNDYYINQRVGIIRSEFNKYIYYCINSEGFNEYVKLLSAGTAQPNISAKDIREFRIAVPSEEEIKNIVKFLDNKFSLVNKIILETEQSIGELKEYKQSIITEAITKGLDPNIEMKDSGIEWIGYVPKDWEKKYIRNYYYQVKDKNADLQEVNLLSLSYGSVIKRDIKSSEGLLPANFKNYNIVIDGDIVLRMTDLQNDKTSLRTGYVNEQGIITSAYITIRTNHTNIINQKYIQLLLHSFDIYKGFYGMGNGVRQNVTFNDIKKLPIILPELTEQEEIIAYLDRKTKNIEKLISDKEKVIDELEQYKKSLIYEYVTGKKEV